MKRKGNTYYGTHVRKCSANIHVHVLYRIPADLLYCAHTVIVCTCTRYVVSLKTFPLEHLHCTYCILYIDVHILPASKPSNLK